jgi:molecular chaperone GrpE
MSEKFNPQFHNAIFEVEDANKPAGTVAVVVKEGYHFKDRILRASMVGTVKAQQ